MLTKNGSTNKVEAILKRDLLLRRENVVLTPHMVFDLVGGVERILETMADNFKAFFEGKNITG